MFSPKDTRRSKGTGGYSQAFREGRRGGYNSYLSFRDVIQCNKHCVLPDLSSSASNNRKMWKDNPFSAREDQPKSRGTSVSFALNVDFFCPNTWCICTIYLHTMNEHEL